MQPVAKNCNRASPNSYSQLERVFRIPATKTHLAHTVRDKLHKRGVESLSGQLGRALLHDLLDQVHGVACSFFTPAPVEEEGGVLYGEEPTAICKIITTIKVLSSSLLSLRR